MSRLARRIWRWSAATLASIAILMALAVGALRIVLPLLPEYKDQLEEAAAQVAGTAVSMGELDVRWLLSGPELVVEGVAVGYPKLGDARAAAPDGAEWLRFERVSLVVSLWAALTGGDIVPTRVVFSGVDFRLERDADEVWRLNGVPVEDLIPEGPSVVPEMEVALRDARLEVRDAARGLGPWQLRSLDLEGEVGGGRRNLRLTATPGDELGSRVEFAFRSDRDGSDSRGPGQHRAGEDHADIYLEAEDLSIPALAALRLPETISARQGRADILLWAELHGDRLQQLDTTVTLSDLALEVSSEDEAEVRDLAYPSAGGRLAWSRTDTGWRLAGHGLDVRHGDETLDDPPSSFRLEASKATGASGQGDPDGSSTLYYGEADFIALDDLVPLLALIPDPVMAHDWLARAPEGDVRNLVFQLRSTDGIPPLVSVRGSFEDVGIQPAAGVPGIQGLDGAVSLTDNSGDIGITAEAVRFTAPGLFREPLGVDRLIGSLGVSRDGERWRLESHGFTLENPHLRVRGRMGLVLGGDAAPEIDLQAQAYGLDLRTKSPYLPVGIMPAPLLGWLERAVVAGRIPEAGLILRGPLDRFPFPGNEGKFEVRFGFDDTHLDFAEGWPAGTGLHGEAVFAGPGLDVHFDGGSVGGIGIESADAGFERLANGELAVDARTAADLEAYLGFLQESPLSSRFGAYLSRLSGHGPGSARVRLDLDVGQVEDVAVDGALTLDAAELGVAGAPEPLVDLSGEIAFTESGISAEAVRGRLFGWPARLQIIPGQVDAREAPGTLVRVTGSADTSVLAELSGMPVRDHASGHFDWVAEAVMPEEPRPDGVPSEIRVTSGLSGLAVNLPPPLAKAASESLPSRVVIRLGEGDRRRVELQGGFGERVGFLARLRETGAEELELEAASVTFGGEEPRLAEGGGIRVSGAVEHLPLDPWLALAPEADGEQVMLRGVALQVGRFEALGQSFRDTYLMASRSGREWLVRLDGEDTLGTLVIPLAGRTAPVIADFQRLVIAMEEEAEAAEAEPADPRRFPGLRFTAESLTLGPAALGRVELDAEPVEGGIHLTKLKATEASFNLDGTGGWYVTPQGHRSELTLTMTSTDVADSLSALGYEGALEAAWGELEMDLSWEGPPTGKVLPLLDGSARLRMEDGQLRAVRPGAGRIFGLLSLNSLPRRLLLDFSDFFSEGLTFDSIAGNYRIEDGDAYTEDLVLKGPSADIGVVGRTGLADKDYDQNVVVSGNFRSSLPVAGALAAGAGVGAALLVFSEIFKDELRDASKVQYRITGDWDSPDIERVAVLPKGQGESAEDGEQSSDGEAGGGETGGR